MYKLLLILKYLRRRRIAWVSLAAVTLCTAMVIVVISIMGGWLRMYETNARGMTGDIVIHGVGLSGFPYYQEMIEEVKKEPFVEAAVPQITTQGLASFGVSDGDAQKTDGVRIFGIKADQAGLVNNWPMSLYRQHTQLLDKGQTPPTKKTFDLRREWSVQVGMLPKKITARPASPGNDDMLLLSAPSTKWADYLDSLSWDSDAFTAVASVLPADSAWKKLRYDPFGRLTLSAPLTDDDRTALLAVAPRDQRWRSAITRLARESNYPGLIAGARLLDITKNREGKLVGREDWKYQRVWAKVTVLGIGANEEIDVKNRAERTYWVVDDSKTGMWQYDNNSLYVDFDLLQRDLGMDAHEEELLSNGEKVTRPARTSEINLRLTPGKNVDEAQKQIEKIVLNVIARHTVDLPTARDFRTPRVETWRQASQTYLDAIENEKVLVVFLFAIVSVVAIFLIFCIFYMIVAEKTKDIGIIKSVGATNTGVAAIFLGYGLFIGVIGASLGLLASYLTIHNINEIHTWLGSTFRIVVWNPEVYAFDTIPSTMDAPTVAVICVTAVIASVLGALVPAIRAARMHPVEALRWE